MKNYFVLILKGMGMGAANVIPGVSGGTIALITGILERLINAIKSFNLTALRLLVKGRFADFARHIDLEFLIAVFLGIGIAIISLARLFEYLFAHYPVYIWSYFFGLILASVFFVGRTVEKWKLSVILIFLTGTAIAVGLSLLKPAVENDSIFYLFLCGIIAACSMILPGVSGSFVLVLMGNYELIMIHSINEMNLRVLIPVLIGAGFGLMAFSYILSWIFKKFRDHTIAVLTGFIFGSLGIIWPWKETLHKMNAAGEFILDRKGEKVVSGYDWFFPATLSTEVIIAIAIIFLGIVSIWLTEYLAEKKPAA
jgi:putative membrane protein